MNEEKIIKIFSNCIIVNGLKRSVIYDLEREEFFHVPNSFYYFFKKYNGKSIKEIKDNNNIENYQTIDEYINFLITNELGFYCDTIEEANCFHKLSLKHETPSHISNAIIDFDNNSSFDFIKIFNQLEELNCQSIEIRFWDVINKYFLIDLLLYLKTSSIRSVELVLKYDNKKNEFLNNIVEFVKLNSRITKIIVYNNPFTKIIKESNAFIIFIKEKITKEDCGKCAEYYFQCNLPFYVEAKNYNSCLNKKIGIDANGEIKNCPSMKQSYGNINFTTLAKVLNNEKFKNLWNITKDKVDICNKCEYRYMCPDCRAYTISNNLYSKPSKCNYDIKTMVWNNKENNLISKNIFSNYEIGISNTSY